MKGRRATRVFISYSRKDLPFAIRLLSALKKEAFDAYLDKEDIAPGEPWRERLGRLILSADNVVFVVSPDAVASEICAWEVSESERLAKRIWPIVWRRVEDARVPAGLSRLNYIFADEEGAFDTAFRILCQALESDMDWIREHTRLGELAARWRERNRASALLLRGSDLTSAEAWSARPPREAPELTDLHRAFIAFSRRSSTRRRRAAFSVAAASIAVIAGIGTLAYFNSQEAQKQERVASMRAGETLQARLQVSERLTESADKILVAGDANLALLLVLEALPDSDSRDPARQNWPYVSAAEVVLYRALQARAERLAVGFSILAAHEQALTSVAFSPDDSNLILGSADKTASLWNVIVNAAPYYRFTDAEGGILYAAFNRDANRILIAPAFGPVRLFQNQGGFPLVTPKLVSEMQGRDVHLRYAEFSPDSKRFVLSFDDGTAQIRETVAGATIATLNEHSNAIWTARFSSDGRWVVTASSDGTARIWSSTTGRPSGGPFEGPQTYFASARFSPDGTQIVTTYSDGSARLWEARSGKLIAELKGHKRDVRDALFSPDGSTLVTISFDAIPRIWDAASGKLLHELRGHRLSVNGAAFTPGGGRLVTVSTDQTARVWDVKTGREVAVLKGHDAAVRGVAINREGTTAATISDDKTARLWPIFAVTDDLVRAARRTVSVCLAGSQRLQFSLPREPPRWCITGAGYENEVDPAKWKAVRPYVSQAWKDWRMAKDRGEDVATPE